MSAQYLLADLDERIGERRVWGTGSARGTGEEAVDVVDLPCEALIALLPEAYVAVDVKTRQFVLANAAAERLLGYSQAELLGLSTADVVEAADGARLELAYQTFVPGTISRREWVLRRRDGHLVPAAVTSVPIVVNGRVIIHMIARDLSEDGPAVAQRTLLSLANERLAVSMDYDATLRAVVGLIVPSLADGCTLDLYDQAGCPRQVARATTAPAAEDGVAVTIVPLRDAEVAGRAGPVADAPSESLSADGEAMTFTLLAHGPALGTLTMHRRPPRAWDPETRTVATALARRAAQAVESALLWETAQRELARRAAILRISRAFAEGEQGSDRMMAVLLNEALALLGGDHGGIAMWDAPSGTLIQVHSNNGRSNGLAVSLENSLSGRAALDRRPAISNAYQR
jgi:PAS domain S-box-containing protein